ncbi:MAG: methylmalonyl-CoA mutase family protein [Ginsengibacter sp.]
MADKSSTVRIVTAASLFDGHDAAINIMRRIMQSKGAEIIHLGHNRSVHEIVECAIEEDADGIAITSYQGGHVEFFKYMKDLLEESGCGHIKIFGGGGGTILPSEIDELQAYGVTRLYSPDDGRRMGLEGMIEDLLNTCKEAKKLEREEPKSKKSHQKNDKFILEEWHDIKTVAHSITLAEANQKFELLKESKSAPVLGITGTGGAGKSSVTDEIVRRFLTTYLDKTIAVISVDPSRKKTGGALLGDRIRMNSIHNPRAYMRSLATRENDKALSNHVQEAIDICKFAGYDFIILESAGVGQSDASILDFVDISMYVMTPEFGAASQLEKINMLDYADIVCINKFDKAGALDALRDVKKQYQRNHLLWDTKDNEFPVIGTVASTFNDPGCNALFNLIMAQVNKKMGMDWAKYEAPESSPIFGEPIIPAKRVRYLAEIAEEIEKYNQVCESQSELASQWYQISGTIALLKKNSASSDKKSESQLSTLLELKTEIEKKLSHDNKALVEEWPSIKAKYENEFFEYDVRGKVIKQPLYFESLSHLKIPKIAVPRFKDWGDILKWRLQENFPGMYPYTAGVFPLKRAEEDPTRMFAGEGGPERTNRRFHYVSLGQPAKRLSTAFDSVTLYGEDPGLRPDIYGKVGNAGVSIATVDDAKKLYSGFDLCDPKTSVSMTINGPAPILLAFFLNAAIDQQCEKYILENNLREKVNEIIDKKYKHENLPKYIGVNGVLVLPEKGKMTGHLPKGNDGLGLRLLGLCGEDVLPKEIYEEIKKKALSTVRGTVQADILKEDQAQNTCIFSTEFALKLMGDVQEYFIANEVHNFYSVSISGYHIAEAGANPITQLAFTLTNGFTYVEYYMSRGMKIDEFAHNLSFFFSNGMDPEYSVIGRVARRIWAKAMKHKYNASERSQKLKYHIQTSGRSLHAQEIDFNDIRTTLQALYAIYDNCNSLHTNAYDEAITTPTEESVRRAMAIQLIINRELGTAKNENPNQGSFLIEELTDLVEEAVMVEFNKISERGGVLGAMERMYQRNKIQEESLYYEGLKNRGEYPIIGVNTFLNKAGSPTILPAEVIRSTTDEKDQQIAHVKTFQELHKNESAEMLKKLQKVAINNGNLFAELMETVKYCSLGQITKALYQVGGQYRRSM